MEDLKAIPYDPDNSLSVKQCNKKTITKYLSRRTSPSACTYCSGGNIHNMPPVEPAIQTKTSLPYRDFKETYH
jgi:hypothetical protein